MIGQGVSSRSSHSAAAGRTTFSAKPCTHSWMSFWSWLSSRLNSVAVVSGAALVSVIVNVIVTIVYSSRRGHRQQPRAARARHRRRDPRALRRQGCPGGGDRRHRARRRHQQGAHLPPRRLQGGALRARADELPRRAARALRPHRRERRSRGDAAGRVRPLRRLLPRAPGLPRLRAVADAPARGRAARAGLGGHLAAPRARDDRVARAARRHPARRRGRGCRLRGQPHLRAGPRHDAPRARRRGGDRHRRRVRDRPRAGPPRLRRGRGGAGSALGVVSLHGDRHQHARGLLRALPRGVERPRRRGDGPVPHRRHRLARPRPPRARPRHPRRPGLHADELGGVPRPALLRARPPGPPRRGRRRHLGLAHAGHDARRARPARLRGDRQGDGRHRRRPLAHARRADRPLPGLLRHERPRGAARPRPRPGQRDGEDGRPHAAPAGPLRAVSDYNVVIAGASTAGCTAARLYGQRGARVALVERKPSPAAYKTVCTHYIQPSANDTIRKVGLAPLIEARGAVRNSVDVWTPYGGWIEYAGEDGGYNVTRRTLDPLLRELATTTPGVDYLPGRTVTGVRRDGLEVREPSGATRRIGARLVVGADGRDSTVAKLARVPGRVKPHNRFFYWAYWRGVQPATDRSRMWFMEPDCAYTFPNEDGLTLALVAPHGDRLPEFREDLEGAYMSMLASLPDAPDLSSAKREGKLLGKLDLPNVMRRAARPGLALVGDAALSSDPLWGIGCGWAFQSADWLVEETADALVGGGDLDAALERYRKAHFRRLAPHHFAIADLASARRANGLEKMLYRASARDRRVAGWFAEVGGRKRYPGLIFRPDRLARIVAAGRG